MMPCCGRTPFEVPRTDRITLDPALVTCEGLVAGARIELAIFGL